MTDKTDELHESLLAHLADAAFLRLEGTSEISRPNSRNEQEQAFANHQTTALINMNQGFSQFPTHHANHRNQLDTNSSSSSSGRRGKRASATVSTTNGKETKGRKRHRAVRKSGSSQPFDDFVENRAPGVNGKKSIGSAKSNGSYYISDNGDSRSSFDQTAPGHPPTPNYEDCLPEHDEYATEAARAAQMEWQATMQQVKDEASRKIDAIRNHIILRFTEATKRSIALHEFYQHWDKPEGEAAYAASLLVGFSPEIILDWRQEFEESNLYLPYDGSADMRPAVKRMWLLEEYPDLLQKAQDWVNAEMLASIERDGKLFRITEFQRWVNEILLVPLYDQPKKAITPISHSTARSWLNRLGYYAEMKRLEDTKNETALKKVSEAFNQLPLSTQGGKVTWPANAAPTPATNTPFASPSTVTPTHITDSAMNMADAMLNVDPNGSNGQDLSNSDDMVPPINITTSAVPYPNAPINPAISLPVLNNQTAAATNSLLERLRQMLAQQRGQNPNIVLTPVSLAQMQAMKFPSQFAMMPQGQHPLHPVVFPHHTMRPIAAVSAPAIQTPIAAAAEVPKAAAVKDTEESSVSETSAPQLTDEPEQDSTAAVSEIADASALKSGDDPMLS